jgi:hypothetical protein
MYDYKDAKSISGVKNLDPLSSIHYCNVKITRFESHYSYTDFVLKKCNIHTVVLKYLLCKKYIIIVHKTVDVSKISRPKQSTSSYNTTRVYKLGKSF